MKNKTMSLQASSLLLTKIHPTQWLQYMDTNPSEYNGNGRNTFNNIYVIQYFLFIAQVVYMDSISGLTYVKTMYVVYYNVPAAVFHLSVPMPSNEGNSLSNARNTDFLLLDGLVDRVIHKYCDYC